MAGQHAGDLVAVILARRGQRHVEQARVPGRHLQGLEAQARRPFGDGGQAVERRGGVAELRQVEAGAFEGFHAVVCLSEGRHRPPLAVRHDPGRLLHARAPGRRVRGPERPAPSARDAAPRHPGFARAFHRHVDRKPCRRDAALAGSGAGRGVLHVAMSRPSVSVPSKAPSDNGGMKGPLMMSHGLSGKIQLAEIATSVTIASTIRPMTPPLLRQNDCMKAFI